MNPTVSILIPVYNVPSDLLRRCISSCLAQTLEDVEIIVVDDGSKEETAKVCDEFSVFKNVKVIHQLNKGLSGARNTAFYAAQGEYITFVDGDDYLDADALMTAYDKAKEEQAQVVLFDYRIISGKGAKEYHSFETDRLFVGDEINTLRLAVFDFN
jgi:glycosyltransferase involved in cell wall biosynthesis